MDDSVLVPAYEVRRTRPVLASVVVEAASEEEAEYFAGKLWVEDAKAAAATAEIKRQSQRPDDTGDARSETRYVWTQGDVADDAAEAFRWGFTADGREPEDCGREQ